MKRKTILMPGEREGRSPMLYVPKGYEQGEVAPIGGCYVCGTPFFPGDDHVAHFKRCVKENEADLREQSIKKRMPMFDGDTWDPEIESHMKKVGERMLAEGRWEVKPNERAGFS